MSIGQYLQETRGELRHVAWPTRTQTIVYTVLVVLLSLGISLYLGVFDFLFTRGLAHFLEVLSYTPPVTVTQLPATTSDSSEAPTSAPQASTTKGGPNFGF